jgi:hypothetical protein
MPYESSLPLVVACLAGTVVAAFIWTRDPARVWLIAAVLAALVGIGAFIVDRLVVTDREMLLELFPRLARAAERQDLDTIIAALDPELRPLRAAAENAMRRVRPTEVVITKLDVSVEPDKNPPEATADLIVRVTGDVTERGASGTVLAGVRVSLRKREGRWLVTDADDQPVTPGTIRR